jgi:hypothetical protein
MAMSTRELTDEEIVSLAQGLESLQGGSMAAAALIGCGERAVPALRSFLLKGRPRGTYQPRQLAVETLGKLGAKDVLLEYLSRTVPIRDPVVRMGEDAVRSTAARELGRWRTEEVFECLSAMASERILPGIVETIGSFRRLESFPYLLRALGDGVCRSYAEDAIRRIGNEAKELLLDAASTKSPSAEEESGSSRQRRQWVLRILADLRLCERDWVKLRHLLEEVDPDIVITAARIGLDTAPVPDKCRAIQRMIEMLPPAGWFLRSEASAALADHFDISREAIEDEVARRSKVDRKQQSLDVVLRLLVNIRNQALQGSFAKS